MTQLAPKVSRIIKSALGGGDAAEACTEPVEVTAA